MIYTITTIIDRNKLYIWKHFQHCAQKIVSLCTMLKMWAFCTGNIKPARIYTANTSGLYNVLFNLLTRSLQRLILTIWTCTHIKLLKLSKWTVQRLIITTFLIIHMLTIAFTISWSHCQCWTKHACTISYAHARSMGIIHNEKHFIMWSLWIMPILIPIFIVSISDYRLFYGCWESWSCLVERLLLFKRYIKAPPR